MTTIFKKRERNREPFCDFEMKSAEFESLHFAGALENLAPAEECVQAHVTASIFPFFGGRSCRRQTDQTSHMLETFGDSSCNICQRSLKCYFTTASRTLTRFSRALAMRSPASHFAAPAVRRLNWQQPLNWRASPRTQSDPARLSSLPSLSLCANVTKAEAVDLILSDELVHFRYFRKME